MPTSSISDMSKVARHVPPTVQRRFDDFGQRLRLARLRRSMSIVEMAERTGISRDTLHRLERGDASISIGALLTVLSTLGLEGDLDLVGAEDRIGRTLQDMALPRGRRRPTQGDPAIAALRRQDLIDFAQRDWSALAESKAAYWPERGRRAGQDAAFQAADEMRRYVALVRPDWPDADARAADLASHVELGESLRRVHDVRTR